jgi:hypothetical protein
VPSLLAALEGDGPAIPDTVDDRGADIIEPLVAIADLAGERWSVQARADLVALRKGAEEPASVDQLLLAAIRDVFDGVVPGGDSTPPVDKILTVDLLRALIEREGEPWAAWWGQEVDRAARETAFTSKDVTPRKPAMELARHLNGFEVHSNTIRMDDGRRGKGYERKDLEEAFAPYLSPVRRQSIVDHVGV